MRDHFSTGIMCRGCRYAPLVSFFHFVKLKELLFLFIICMLHNSLRKIKTQYE
jgi:hypothetical protein